MNVKNNRDGQKIEGSKDLIRKILERGSNKAARVKN
jgi:hypothetical protein